VLSAFERVDDLSIINRAADAHAPALQARTA
jgi:hypothetical protein